MENVESQIIKVIDRIRPFLIGDGGDIEFVKFEDGIVYVKMLNACADCINNTATIQGVEVILMEEVPGILGVEIVQPSLDELFAQFKD